MPATTDIQFVDQAAAEATLADIRNDHTDTDWAVWLYKEPSQNVLECAVSGSGGLEELMHVLTPTVRGYAFLRVTDIVDNHATVKFIFIAWAGEQVSVIKKARMTTHKGSITKFIGVRLTFPLTRCHDILLSP